MKKKDEDRCRLRGREWEACSTSTTKRISEST